MAVHLYECRISGTPPEPQLLEAVTLRLIEDCERQRFDEELKGVVTGWMEAEDRQALQVVHADGKVIKNAQPAPPRSPAQQLTAAAQAPSVIPPELQNPKPIMRLATFPPSTVWATYQ